MSALLYALYIVFFGRLPFRAPGSSSQPLAGTRRAVSAHSRDDPVAQEIKESLRVAQAGPEEGSPSAGKRMLPFAR